MSSRPRVRRLVVVLLAVVTVGLAGCTSGAAESKVYQFDGATKIGAVIPPTDRKPAPAIASKLLDGGSTSVASRKGKIVVLPFWASWCGPCRVEMPMLQSVRSTLAADGVDLLGVNTRDDDAAATAFLRGHDVTFPSLVDRTGDVAAGLGNVPAALPFTLVVDRRGRVAAVYLGRYTSVDLDRALAKLQAER